MRRLQPKCRTGKFFNLEILIKARNTPLQPIRPSIFIFKPSTAAGLHNIQIITLNGGLDKAIAA